MDYYSELFKFDEDVKPKKETFEGKDIYAIRFSAEAAEKDRGLMYTLATGSQLGHSNLEQLVYDLKWHRIKSSLCDEKGNLISDRFIESLMKSRDPKTLEFIEIAYKHVQVVNEIGIHGKKSKGEENPKS